MALEPEFSDSNEKRSQARAVRVAWGQRNSYFLARRSLERAKAEKIDPRTIALLEEDVKHQLEELQQTADNSEDILDGAYAFWEESQNR